MATRSGSVDPGLVLWLLEHVGMPPAEMAMALDHRSGLLGLAGTADMRELLAGVDAGRDDARLALDVFLHRLRAAIAAMTAALGGLDVLVFTGGIGERAPQIRALAAGGLAFLGLGVDPDRNDGAHPPPDAEIGAPDAPVRVLVVEAREDLEIARQVREVLTS